MREVEDRQAEQLGFVVPEPIAERGVDGEDAAVEARERHPSLRLLEQRAEAPLAFPLGDLRAMTLGDVVNEGQQPAMALHVECAYCRLDLDAAAVLRDQRRLVTEWHLSAGEPVRQLVGESLAFFRWCEIDQRGKGGQLRGGVTGEVLVGGVSGYEHRCRLSHSATTTGAGPVSPGCAEPCGG